MPAARRFVDDVLTTWGRDELIDDVALSVTELVTNATLHSQSTWFDVEMSAHAEVVRVAVVDSGTMPASSIAARSATAPGRETAPEVDFESMTGRGLFIVSALATSWGIDDLPDGTRIWADFGTGEPQPRAAPQVSSRMRAPNPVTDDGALVIRLVGCPAEVLLAHDEHLADVARELTLFAASHSDGEAAESAIRVAEVVRLSALSWDAARLVAAQALREGRRLVDIAIVVNDPADLPNKVRTLQVVTAKADAMAEGGVLMTPSAPLVIRQWRAWVAAEMVDQVTDGRAPIPFAEWSSAHADQPT